MPVQIKTHVSFIKYRALGILKDIANILCIASGTLQAEGIVNVFHCKSPDTVISSYIYNPIFCAGIILCSPVTQ